jgi:lysophospholipase L1-like esterase
MTEKTTPARINSKKLPKPRKNKILIIGDSHARGCVAELSSTLGENFEVKGTVMPGSTLEHTTNLARQEISLLHRNDFVVICGGANDISRNESNIGLRHLRKFALENEHTNIVAITPPHRYNLQDSSCINTETQIFSRKLHKLQKDLHHVDVIDSTQN